MFKNKLTSNYFCVCGQAHKKKIKLRKHVSICKYAQNKGNQYVTCPTKKDLLQLAISKCEIQNVNDNLNTFKDTGSERFKCGCEKRFKSKGGYYRHIKKCKFRPEQQIVAGKTKCNEPGCLLTFKYIRDFRQHLNEKHNIQFDVEEKIFNRYSDFLRWKENYESETSSCFYHRKTETRSGRKVEYWYCNRSGIYQSIAQGRRRKLKSQGILKINNNCTSSITLTINEIEGTVQAIIYHTHYGHEAELVHLRIPNSDKQEIASKLLQGVKIEDILLSYKEDGLSNKIERKHLIKRRDILNISKKYNVNIILPKTQKPSKKDKNYGVDQEPVDAVHFKDVSHDTIETEKRHTIASQLSLSIVSQIYENVWKITMENNLVSTTSTNSFNNVCQVTKNYVKNCTDACKVYCHDCRICYHSYSCTCTDFLSKKCICEHVHLVVIFQETPLTYQYQRNIEESLYNNQDHTTYTRNFLEPVNSTEPHESVCLSLDLGNNDYIQNKQITKLENLKIRMEKLMMDTLQKINECNNCDLIENIKKQVIDISSSLSLDLQQNKKKSDETQITASDKNIEVFYVF